MVSENVKPILNMRRLRNIRRCNNFPTATDINVAEHSYNVAMLSLMLSKEYNRGVKEHNDAQEGYEEPDLKCEINIGDVLYKSLLHDVPESMTGDISWAVKHSSVRMNNEVKAIEELMTQTLMSGNPQSLDPETLKIVDDIMGSKDGFEGSVVSLADMMELAIYSWEEVNMGNKFMAPMLSKCIILIQAMDIYTTMLEFCPTLGALMDLLQGKYGKAEELYYI